MRIAECCLTERVQLTFDRTSDSTLCGKAEPNRCTQRIAARRRMGGDCLDEWFSVLYSQSGWSCNVRVPLTPKLLWCEPKNHYARMQNKNRDCLDAIMEIRALVLYGYFHECCEYSLAQQ